MAGICGFCFLVVVLAACLPAASADSARRLVTTCNGNLNLQVQVGIYLDEVISIEPTQFRAVVTRVGRYQDFTASFLANATRVIMPVPDARKIFWDPQLRFSNLAASTEFELLENRFDVQPNGLVTVTERTMATFRHALDLTLFPFDEQDLEIKVTPTSCTAGEIVLTSLEDESGTKPFDFGILHLWHSVSHTMTAGTATHGMAGSVSLSPISEAVMSIKIRRSATTLVKGYVLPSQLLLVGSWASFWLSADSPLPRVATTWLVLLTWLNFQRRLEQYGMPQMIQNNLVDVFAWSVTIMLFVAIMQNVVTLCVGRLVSVVLAEKFDFVCRVLYPAFWVIFWIILTILLAGIQGMRGKTPSELNFTFDLCEGLFVAIVLFAFALTTGIAVFMSFTYHQRILQHFVNASSHMVTEQGEIAVLFRYIAGRTEGWTAGRRRVAVSILEIDHALDANHVPDEVRRGVKDAFQKQAMDPNIVSQHEFCTIWGQLTQVRYEHFKKDPNQREFKPGPSSTPHHVAVIKEEPWSEPQRQLDRQPGPPSEVSWPASIPESSPELGALHQHSPAAAPGLAQRQKTAAAPPRQQSPLARGPVSPTGTVGSVGTHRSDRAPVAASD